GQCGACTVLVNGRRINACLTLAVMHEGDDVVTIEGLGRPETSVKESGWTETHTGRLRILTSEPENGVAGLPYRATWKTGPLTT
ncbi:MAG: hypothetical protein ACXW25_07605, partial [Rhodospirillales bacterium]